MRKLRNRRLEVWFAEPGEKPNGGFRFDRAGYVTDVILDGMYRFLAEEPKYLFHPITGGRGLCCEYGMDNSNEVANGELFVKPGVGLMKKKEPYIFYGSYEGLQPFPVLLKQQGEECITFLTEPLLCDGYALRCEKTFCLTDTTLTMDARIVNVGEKTFETEEYCHNFLCIDGMSISPDYHLELPMKAGVPERILDNVFENESNLKLEKTGVSFLRQEQEVSMSHIPVEDLEISERFCWKLENKKAKAWVAGCDKIAFHRLTLWTCDHIISPEIFQKFRLAPGEAYEWQRSWTFGQAYSRKDEENEETKGNILL